MMIDKHIQGYSNRFTSGESLILTEIRERTMAERVDNKMLSGFYQGRVLATLSKMMSPTNILEIGTYMGYSALCLAEGLSENGKLITIDPQPETYQISTNFFKKSEFANQIDARFGLATDIIPTLKETFDLVFIDADKPNYANYFDLVLPKLRIGGIIIADNVLWSGHVLEVEKGTEDDESCVALHEFNKKVLADERVSNVLMTIRDGLMVIRKEKA
jgi:predicted O-methyltransferase YrrM